MEEFMMKYWVDDCWNTTDEEVDPTLRYLYWNQVHVSMKKLVVCHWLSVGSGPHNDTAAKLTEDPTQGPAPFIGSITPTRSYLQQLI